MAAQPANVSRAALELTYVLYDESSTSAQILALLTLSPILLNPAYAALTLWTRELVFLEMWAGQMLCEASNYVLKHVVREDRPNEDLGDGYGFPSSHSQWMGYFASFLFLHFSLRHRWVSTGFVLLDYARDVLLFAFILSWSAAVAFSRYYLSYHTIPQVLWGFSIGVIFGSAYYTLVELIPTKRPDSLLGRFRTTLLTNPVCAWFRLRDGWAVWSDAGTDAQYAIWREKWDRQRLASAAKAKRE
ncbi:PAP2-domain-containing protein [Lentinus tigrinus ALCF2SS1-7]|uniref:PAP2-domain-containing protein n=1 Tax=Lentinus tigrinus ALCF2SS1-6 TaxID=1328759 RepID=A0A5C2S5H6_9APHY|nr:PAP2-domain-containing protein [Lentinus tigrinus ALCF2SS1-6]RPD73291.1 PAP2-domain-containing protein [Lentinus tigrinus ALCF2SS1-7]